MRLVPGERFGKYVVEAELGRGGQAVVYRARDEGLDREVALKVFAAEAARPRDLERFRREAIAAARLDHPRIVTVYDAGEAGGRAFIAMRLVAGTTLAGEVARMGPLDLERAVAVLDDVAQALDFAHARGLVHRDVKSANILIDRDGTAYLSDFGLARVEGLPGLTGRGDWMGTAEFVAPELVEGNPATTSSDIYGLGVVAFEALTGRVPFVHAEATAVLLAHVRDPVPAASSLNARLPARVDAALARALAKGASDRPPRARILVEEIRSALGEAPARPTVVAGRAPESRPTATLSAGDPWTQVLARFTDTGAAPPAGGETTRLADGAAPSRRLPVTRRLVAAASLGAVLALAAVGAAGFFAGGAAAPDSDKARAEGVALGEKRGFARGKSAGLTEGRTKGLSQGLGRGKTLGRRDGLRQGIAQGRTEGYSDGYDKGRQSVFGGLEGGPPSPSTWHLVKIGGEGAVETWFARDIIPGECLKLTVQEGLQSIISANPNDDC
jgi:predicted Ser/Thr protein kinase